MSTEEEAGPGAFDVMKANIQQALDGIQELSLDLEHILEVEEPTVTVPKDTLRRLLDDVSNLREQFGNLLESLTKQEKSSLFSLYYGVFLGALIGVIGNFFVQLWFAPLTLWTWVGLGLSFFLFIVVCTLLLYEAKKYRSTR